MRKFFLVISLLSLSAFGAACSSKSDNGKKLAALCVQATDQLAKDSQGADDDTMMLMIQNALNACSGGCDAKDDASCKALDSHIDKVCGVSPKVCESLCGSVKSPSLKKASCAKAGK